MSLSLAPLSIVQCLDPLTNINNVREYAVLRGGSEISWKPNISTSYSITNLNFTAPPPNPGIIVNRKVKLNATFLLTFSGVGLNGGPLLTFTGGIDAPRAFPLAHAILTTTVTINNTSVSFNTSDIIDPLLHYHSPEKMREIDNSLTPSMLDQSQEYSDLLGGSRNPLNNYASSVSGADMARGAFPFTVLTNTNLSATVLVTFTEPLFLPPFESGCGDHGGFVGVQTMDFVFNLGNLGNALWSHDAVNGGLINSISVTIPAAPQLLFNYITPNQLLPVPALVTYPYFDIQRYVTNVGVIQPGATLPQVQSNNIQLHSVPRRMYVYARRRNGDKSYNTTDTFAAIDRIVVNWDNRNAQLSSATPFDIYTFCVANGMNLSWNQFNKQVGSPVCIEFGRQLPLNGDQCPGMLGTFQLQLNVDIRNSGSNAVNYDLYIVIVNEGSFTITENRAVTQIGVVSRADVLNSLAAPSIDYNKVMAVQGGDFFSGIKDFFGKVYDTASSVYQKIKPVADVVIPIARTLMGKGAPVGGKKRGRKRAGAIVGGKKHKSRKSRGSAMVGGRKKRGGVVVGGAKMARQMMHLM